MSDLDDKLREIFTRKARINHTPMIPGGTAYTFENLDDCIAQIKQAFAEDMDGKHFTVVPNDANYMTGQEWYDRLLKELPHAPAYTYRHLTEAAKKAANL